jgi:hypothetical protein
MSGTWVLARQLARLTNTAQQRSGGLALPGATESL